MLRYNSRLQICVVQELRGNHRVLPLDYRDQSKQVRGGSFKGIFIKYIVGFNAFSLHRSKTIFNTPGEEDIGIYSCLVTHTDGASSSYTFSTEGRFKDENIYTEFMLLFAFLKINLLIFSELKRLLEISHDHKFPSKFILLFQLWTVHIY